MGSAVAVFLKNGLIQAAHVTGSSRSPRLRALVEAPRDEADRSLATLLTEHRIPRKQVTLVLPARLVSVRKTTIPLTNLQQIRRTLKFHAERLIPGVTPEEIAADFFVTRREKTTTELFLLVVKKTDLEVSLQIARENEIDPDVVTVDFIAFFNLLSHFRLFDGAPVTAAIDFSGEGTSLLLVKDGHLQSYRKLPAFGAGDPADRLTREVKYALTAGGFTAPADRVILAGSVPEELDVASIQERLGSTVTTCDVPKLLRFSGNKNGTIPNTPVAPGAALGVLGKPALAINFRRKEYSYLSPYETLRKPILLALVMLVAFIAIEFIGTMQARGDATNYLGRMTKEAKSLFAKVVRGKKPKFTSTFHKTLEGVVKQRSGSSAGELGWRSYLDFLKIFCEHLPTDYAAVIQSVTFRGTKVTVRGEAQDVASFEKLCQGLEESGAFEVRTPFRIRSGRQTGPARLAFTVELSPKK